MAHFNPQMCDGCSNCDFEHCIEESLLEQYDPCHVWWRSRCGMQRVIQMHLDSEEESIINFNTGFGGNFYSLSHLPPLTRYSFTLSVSNNGTVWVPIKRIEVTTPGFNACCSEYNPLSPTCREAFDDILEVEVTYSGYSGCLEDFNGTYILSRNSNSDNRFVNYDVSETFIESTPYGLTAPVCSTPTGPGGQTIHLFYFAPMLAFDQRCGIVIDGPYFGPLSIIGTPQTFGDRRGVPCKLYGETEPWRVFGAGLSWFYGEDNLTRVMDLIGDATISWNALE